MDMDTAELLNRIKVLEEENAQLTDVANSLFRQIQLEKQLTTRLETRIAKLLAR